MAFAWFTEEVDKSVEGLCRSNTESSWAVDGGTIFATVLSCQPKREARETYKKSYTPGLLQSAKARGKRTEPSLQREVNSS